MSQSWLSKQRKQALIDLSAEAGLDQSDSRLRKEDIVQNLHEYLHANAVRLQDHESFQGYYNVHPYRITEDRPLGSVRRNPRGRRGSQIKHEEAESATPLTSPSILHSITKVLEPVATTSSTLARRVLPFPSSASTALVTSTPAQTVSRRRRSEVPGPASPSVIADAIEQSSAQLHAELSSLYTLSGISGTIARVRETLSSVTGIQMTVLALEVLALQKSLIPFRYLGETPRVFPTLGYGEAGRWASVAVHYPDFFVLLSPEYWAATLLWASTSLFVPVLFAYFYNLGLRKVRRGEERVLVGNYAADPVTYNVIKALATWVVYQRGVSFGGLVGERAAEAVESAVLGGSTGILIGSAIGVLAALYEATLRKAPA